MSQEPWGYDNLIDTDIELEHGSVHDTKEVENTINSNINTAVYENRQDKEVNEEFIFSNLEVES